MLNLKKKKEASNLILRQLRIGFSEWMSTMMNDPQAMQQMINMMMNNIME